VFAALVAEVASDNAVGRTQCYLMHGDPLEHSSAQPSGDDQHGYAEQLLAPAICVRRGSSCAGVHPSAWDAHTRGRVTAPGVTLRALRRLPDRQKVANQTVCSCGIETCVVTKW